MGNLLAANSNLSGSVHHYRQALIQNPDHADAYLLLRVVACYHKFHRNVPAAAPASESSSALQQTCSKNAAKPREAVFICTKVGFIPLSTLTTVGT